MKTNHIAFSIISIIALLAFFPLAFRFNFAHAQTDASSTDASSSMSSDQSTTPPAFTTPPTDQASTTPPPAASPAPTLTLVHTAGTKYIDYCTDGSTISAHPGDQAIDANLDKPDAPIPQCPEGQTWDHTYSMPGYDTASGDLEIGQYALQEDGTFIVHYPAMTYTDATSTVQWPDRVTTVQSDPTATSHDTSHSDTPSTTTSSGADMSSTTTP